MTEPEEECELQQLVPSEEDHRSVEQYGQVTPPVSPGISKVTQTSPTSPANHKVNYYFYLILIFIEYIKCVKLWLIISFCCNM